MEQELAKIQEEQLMTPEEMALLKKLQEKRKAQQKALGGVKEKLFEELTENFGSAMSKVKKDVVTISIKEPAPDGNIYAITFGVENEDEDQDQEIDTNQLATKIIEQNMSIIEPLMGISQSIKVSGTYKGKKLFWQIRKRPA